MPTTIYLVAGITFLITFAVVLAPSLLRPSAQTQHILNVVANKKPAVSTASASRVSMTESIIKLAASMRVRMGFAENAKSKRKLNAAGYRSSNASDLYFAAQCLCPILGIFAGSFIHDSTIFWVIALAMVGYLAPDFWLGRKIEARKKKIQRGMPDTIDLLVICVDAGLGLDQALLRINDELKLSHPQIYEELQQVHLEQKAGQPRLVAWNNAATRTAVEEFIGFANMLTQTERFGTPIAKALTRFSEDLRMKRRQHAEEAAAKTKIKIIFPLVFFIFPCLFIVLLAPALLSIISGLHQMAK
ncbi:type II secretion system F family protein [Granulicella paludicola]|uniref:type II secretion system F family protein n=1 Tax=Granulicella paludicola TaxID=474951 RepID=UPI0021DFA3F0|nr:type II secretion system F family protein [Granulicella paludicola]